MQKTKLKVLALYASVFLFTAGSFFAASQGLKAGQTPTSVQVTLYKTELYTSATGTAVTVFDNPSGAVVDIAQNASNAFGQGTIPVGTYKRIVFTVDNSIQYIGPNPCSSGTPTVSGTQQISLSSGHVQLVFATADDGGSTAWSNNGTFGAPFLIQNPVAVRGNTTTVVKLLFNISQTLNCTGGSTVELLPPTMNAINYVEQAPVTGGACTFPADYWFMHYSVRSSLQRAADGSIITNLTTTELLQNAEVVSGWGTINFSSPDSTGNGRFSIVTNQSYTAGGMAEHRHNLASYCTDTTGGCGYSGYFNPVSSDPGSNMPPVLTGNYTLSGGTMIMQSPGGGTIQGGMTSDCSTFVGVDISSVDGNDLIYAVRKPTAMASTLPFNATMIMIGPEFNLSYDMTNPTGAISLHPAQWLGFDSKFSVLAVNSGTNSTMFEWSSQYNINPWWQNGLWYSQGPSERASQQTMDMTSFLSIQPDGLIQFVPQANNNEFDAFGTSGSGIQAGETTDYETYSSPSGTNYDHRVMAGFLLNADPSPTLSDLAGTWTVGLLESHLSDGGDGVWNTGNEQLQFGITYGQITVDSTTGKACGTFSYKDAFTNELQPPNTGCSTIVLKTECYAYNQTTGQGLNVLTTQPCVIPGTTSSGITLPVFYAMNPNGVTVDEKLVLDKTKKVLSIWKPISTTDTPVSSPTNTGCVQGAAWPNGCGNPALSSNAGLGVKIQ